MDHGRRITGFGITSRLGLNSSLSFSSSKASILVMFLHICFFICETDNRIDPQSGSQRQPRDTAQKRLPEDEKVAGNSVCGYINTPALILLKEKIQQPWIQGILILSIRVYPAKHY